jgi:hypothetical protein
MRQKTFTILAILLVCTMAASVLECQVHAEVSSDAHATAHEHATTTGHHQSSSPDTTGHMACLIAVLPTVVFLVWFASMWFHISCWFVRLTPHVFPPFIPPKLRCALRVDPPAA